MKTIDNVDTFLVEDLAKVLHKGSKVYVLADCFSLYLFEVLKAQLQNCASFHFLFMDKVNIDEEEEDPSGFTHHRSLVDRRGLVIDCVRWIQAKARFKLTHPLPGQDGSILIANKHKLYEYTDPLGFTRQTLSWPAADPASARILHNVEQLKEAAVEAAIIRQKMPLSGLSIRYFQNLWNDTERTKDVTDEVVQRIMNLW